VASANRGQEKAAFQQGRIRDSDALVGFLQRPTRVNIAGIEDEGQFRQIGAILRQRSTECRRTARGARPAVIELHPRVIGQTQQGDFTVFGHIGADGRGKPFGRDFGGPLRREGMGNQPHQWRGRTGH